MGIIHEPFERCEQCGHHEFDVRRVVRVVKGSDRTVPIAQRDEHRYECLSCRHMQYIIREEGGY